MLELEEKLKGVQEDLDSTLDFEDIMSILLNQANNELHNAKATILQFKVSNMIVFYNTRCLFTCTIGLY